MGERPAIVYFDGDFVDYHDAKIHILSTAVKYAAVVFEGIRAYWNAQAEQLYVFRLEDHLKRLEESARLSRIPFDYDLGEVQELVLEAIRRNELRQDLHIRVQLLVDEDNGVLYSTGPVALAISPVPMGRFPDMEESPGLRVAVSHWQRISDSSLPPRIKSISNYTNGRLALLQARNDGYDDAILLDSNGRVTEGPGWNIFAVVRGKLVTPPVTSGILEGVTRDTLLTLIPSVVGHEVDVREIDKTELYLADEAFFCGSGKEVKPIMSVDGHLLGSGNPGPHTVAVLESYINVVRGVSDGFADWRTPVFT